MPTDTKQLVQRQFAAHAAGYIASAIHAQGYSLSRLIELLDPQPNWRILDVATGGGHMALANARRSQNIVATDLTRSMLQAARSHIEQQGITHVTCCQSDAERLPFAAILKTGENWAFYEYHALEHSGADNDTDRVHSRRNQRA